MRVHGSFNKFGFRAWPLITVLILVVLFMVSPAHAGVLGDVETGFQGRLASTSSAFSKAATGIFWSLATISFIWSMSQLAVRSADLGEIVSEVIRFIITIGVFWFILENGPQIALAISSSFSTLASSAGAGTTSTPDGVIASANKLWGDSFAPLFSYSQAGSQLCQKVYTESGGLVQGLGAYFECDLTVTFGSWFMALSFVLTYVILIIVAIDMLILRITLFLVIYLGIILLGFGGFRRTEDMAVNYLKTVASVAIANMTMAVIASIGISFVQAQSKTMVTALTAFSTALNTKATAPITIVPFQLCVEGLIAAIAIMFLIKRVPHIMGQMVGGVNAASQVSGAGGALVGAGFAAAAAGGAAMASAGASLAANAAAKGVEATKAGADLAGAVGEGAGAFGGGGGGLGEFVSGGGGSVGGGSGLTSSGADTPLAKAAGDNTSAGRGAGSPANDTGAPGSTSAGETVGEGAPADQGAALAGEAANAGALPGDIAGGESGPAVGADGQSATGAESGGGVSGRSAPGATGAAAGAAAGLVAAGTALRLGGAAGKAAVALHEGNDPVSAARSALGSGTTGRPGASTAAGGAATPATGARPAGTTGPGGVSAASTGGASTPGGSGWIGGGASGGRSGGGRKSDPDALAPATGPVATPSSGASSGAPDTGLSTPQAVPQSSNAPDPDNLAPAVGPVPSPPASDGVGVPDETQDGDVGNVNRLTGQGPTQVRPHRPGATSIDADPLNNTGTGSINPGTDQG